MKKAALGATLFMASVLLLICYIVQKEKKTQSINESESYHINDYNAKELIQTSVQELMPKIVDVIVDESEIVALCEDGSVWSWEKEKDKNTACKIQNLSNVKKIVYAGSAIYALSEDGYVYAWGSNEWLQINSAEDRNKVFEEARQLTGLSDIVDIDACIDTNSGRVRAFAIDESGNFCMWGIYLYWLENEDLDPGFPEEYMELVQGVDKVFAGAGNYHYFIREDGTIFSIMGTSIWQNEHIIDFIFPSLPIKTGTFQMDNKSLDELDSDYVDLRINKNGMTKYGITILYELGQEKSIQCMDADKYTMFMSDEEGGLWYWDSKMILYHDCKDAIADSERYREDYAGNWKSVDIKEILGRENESGYAPYIVKICAGSENVFFLTNDGQVFMSEYITNAVEDVDYYNHESTNPNRERIITARDLHLKTIVFHKMDWKNIISINTDGTHFFSAVDKDGRYFYIDTDNLFEGTYCDEDKAQYAPETGFSNRVMTAEKNYVYWKETLIFGDSVYKLDNGTYKKEDSIYNLYHADEVPIYEDIKQYNNLVAAMVEDMDKFLIYDLNSQTVCTYDIYGQGNKALYTWYVYNGEIYYMVESDIDILDRRLVCLNMATGVNKEIYFPTQNEWGESLLLADFAIREDGTIMAEVYNRDTKEMEYRRINRKVLSG